MSKLTVLYLADFYLFGVGTNRYHSPLLNWNFIVMNNLRVSTFLLLLVSIPADDLSEFPGSVEPWEQISRKRPPSIVAQRRTQDLRDGTSALQMASTAQSARTVPPIDRPVEFNKAASIDFELPHITKKRFLERHTQELGVTYLSIGITSWLSSIRVYMRNAICRW